ncbi:hypothetical protein [Chroococcidiopsis sp. TS-821]|uniref:hypothetical protein n=1 Tax=Chroococcidiopsis sp. TS-821 TaxID=1378066 RepID=UPI0011B0A81A|nr:hypothetical protein [Chroococcidiopsis sp. TS-821]
MPVYKVNHMLNIQLKIIFLMVSAMLFVACQKAQTSQLNSALPATATVSQAVAVKNAANSSSRTSTNFTKQTTSPNSAKAETIGHAIDCDNDGRDNDYRIDRDADGIPDDCLISDDDTSMTAIDTTNPQNLFDIRMKLLNELTAGCTENSKVEGDITYSICFADGQPVKAAEFLTEFGDGLNIWFERGKVKAILRTHSGEMFFFKNGDLELKFEDYGTQVVARFSPEERNEYEEIAKTAHHRIFRIFNIE